MSFSVGSINFIAEKIFVCTFKIFRLLLPLKGRSWSVTGVVIISLIMTVAVAISIVCCVIVLFASGVNAGSFGVIFFNFRNLFFVLFSFECCYIFGGWWNFVGDVKGGGLFFERLFFLRHHCRYFCWSRGVGRVVRR